MRWSHGRSPDKPTAHTGAPGRASPLLSVSALALGLGLLLPVPAALAQTAAPDESAAPSLLTDEDEAAEITADELVHDKDTNIVTATGNVEVIYKGRIARADKIVYDVDNDKVTAEGNASLLEADGTIIYADYVELTGDLKEGVARNIRMLLSNGLSRLTAEDLKREDGNITTLDHATYTACKPCEDDPEAPPLWQLRASEVIHDQEEKEVRYWHARMEMWGVPVFYTPYLEHPDPTVKRQSGFLTPSAGSSKNLGYFVETPYFWAYSDYGDLTLRPRLTTDENAGLAANWRHMWESSDVDMEASATVDSDDEFRGHVDGTVRHEFDDIWVGNLQLQRTTDDTYLRRYKFGEDSPILTTTGSIEGFAQRSYLGVEGFTYQGLRDSDDPGTTPWVLPLVNYNYVGTPDEGGDYWSFDANTMALFRDEGSQSRRLSLSGGWTQPWYSPIGEVYRLSAGIRGDLYHVDDVIRDDGTTYDGVTGRVIPQVALDWRYPFQRIGESSVQTIEPIVVAVASPYGGNPDEIPNEDSLNFEFDDTNLFSHSRFPGLDRVEGGPRVSYGLRWMTTTSGGPSAEVLLGQSFRVHKSAVFSEESGLNDNFSDVVGRIRISASDWWNIAYRFRIDPNDFVGRYHDVNGSVGVDELRLNAQYLYLNGDRNNDPDNLFGDREELSLSLSSMFSENWSGQVFTKHDLSEDGGPLRAGMGLTYEDECFAFTSTLVKDYTSDRDLKSGLSVYFQIAFKTLTEFQTGIQGP